MRRLAAVLTGLLTLAVLLSDQPWDRACDPRECTLVTGQDELVGLILTSVIVWLLPAMILVTVLQGLLGIKDASRPREDAVLAALGQSQADATRAAARLGLRHGLLAVIPAWVVAGGVQVALLASRGWPLGTDAYHWGSRSIVAAMAVGCLVGAHALDSSRPHLSPVERLHVRAGTTPTRAWSLARRAAVLGGIAAAAAGLVLGLALAWHEPVPWDGFVVTNAAGIATLVVALALTALAFAAIIPAAREATPRIVALTARGARRAGRTQVATVLDAHAVGPSIAASGALGVIAASGFLAAVLLQVEPAPVLTTTIAGVMTVEPADAAPGVAERVESVDGVAHVVPATTHGDHDMYWPMRVSVDPAALDAAAPALAAQLRDEPTVIVAPAAAGDANAVNDGDLGATGRRHAVTGGWTFSHASLDTLPTAALLIFADDAADLAGVAERVDVLDLSDLGLEGSGMAYTTPASRTSGTDWITLAALAALVLVPGAAVAAGMVQRRRRDDATLAALGASRSAVRAAAAIEAGVIAAVGAGAGLVSGALAHAGTALVDRWRFSLTGVITDHEVAWALGTVAWGVLGAILSAVVAVFAITAWVTASRHGRGTPVANLASTETGALA